MIRRPAADEDFSSESRVVGTRRERFLGVALRNGLVVARTTTGIWFIDGGHGETTPIAKKPTSKVWKLAVKGNKRKTFYRITGWRETRQQPEVRTGANRGKSTR